MTPAPTYETITYRPWRRLVVDKFREELRQSELCCNATGTDVNTLAELYESELHAILDCILPVRTSACRRKP